MKDIKDLTNNNTPNVKIDNLNFYYSDSAYIRFRMIAPKVIIKYEDKTEVIREFPKGLTLYSYNKVGAKNTELLADYAIHFIDSNLWLAQKNVKCKTKSGIKLTTEKVYWDMMKKIFYTDEPLTIEDNQNTIHGKGLIADENFNYIQIKKTTGEIFVEKNEVLLNKTPAKK